MWGIDKKKKPTYTTNFWSASGVYFLLKDFNVVYVGKADLLGKRIIEHITDRFAGRWDMFSWFSVNYPNKTNPETTKLSSRYISASYMINTIEAVGILLANPPLNRKREKPSGAIEFLQKDAITHKTHMELLSFLTGKGQILDSKEQSSPIRQSKKRK